MNRENGHEVHKEDTTCTKNLNKCVVFFVVRGVLCDQWLAVNDDYTLDRRVFIRIFWLNLYPFRYILIIP